MNIYQKNKKKSGMQTQNRVININASKNKRVQNYIKKKVKEAKKEIENIENEIIELEQN